MSSSRMTLARNPRQGGTNLRDGNWDAIRIARDGNSDAISIGADPNAERKAH